MTERTKQEQVAMAAEARRRNKEARDAAKREYWAQEDADKAAAVAVWRSIRDNEQATPGERLEAIRNIEFCLNYHHTPPQPLIVYRDRESTDGTV